MESTIYIYLRLEQQLDSGEGYLVIDVQRLLVYVYAYFVYKFKIYSNYLWMDFGVNGIKMITFTLGFL